MPSLSHGLLARLILLGLCLSLGQFLPPASSAVSAAGTPTDNIIYSDSLSAAWENWSWDSTLNFNATNPISSGTHSLAVTYNQGWAGLYLHSNAPLNAANLQRLQFAVHGGSAGGQAINVVLYDGAGAAGGSYALPAPTAGQWAWVSLPLTAFSSVPATLTGIVWQSNSPNAQATYYLDEIRLTTLPAPPLALSVNVSADRYPISRDIYGMNFAEEDLAAELNLPVHRWGGNSTSRYNWQLEMTNIAGDWYFENLPITLSVGVTFDQFVAQDQNRGTRTIATIPALGWVASPRREDHPYDCGFKVSRYGAQQSVDPWDSDCGNGRYPNGTHITGNNPADTSMPVTPAFAQQWVQHLVSEFGTAAQGGVRFYNLDNEPSLWNDTHRDVHGYPTSYDEMYTRTVAYAAAIKAADPSAQVLGPVEWGWPAYFYSALDWAPGGNWEANPQDRLAHGNIPFTQWYLQQLRAYEQQNGTRLLNYLDWHYYPQAPGVALASAGNATTQALRLRSTRSLWDPTYADESWIANTGPGPYVRLLPRMRELVDTYYPGTKLAITEYNWGALDHLNGALTQADVLGIFGRERLDLATLWAAPTSTVPGAFAFRMYLNYNGQGGAFGDVSVRATSTDQEQLAIYAAQRLSDSALTLMVINKTTGPLTVPVALANFSPGVSALVYRYSAANLNAIQTLPAQAVGPTGFTATYPAQSITLFVIPSNTSLRRVYVPLVKR